MKTSARDIQEARLNLESENDVFFWPLLTLEVNYTLGCHVSGLLPRSLDIFPQALSQIAATCYVTPPLLIPRFSYDLGSDKETIIWCCQSQSSLSVDWER